MHVNWSTTLIWVHWVDKKGKMDGFIAINQNSIYKSENMLETILHSEAIKIWFIQQRPKWDDQIHGFNYSILKSMFDAKIFKDMLITLT